MGHVMGFSLDGGGGYSRMVKGWSGKKKTEAMDYDFVVPDVVNLERERNRGEFHWRIGHC